MASCLNTLLLGVCCVVWYRNDDGIRITTMDMDGMVHLWTTIMKRLNGNSNEPSRELIMVQEYSWHAAALGGSSCFFDATPGEIERRICNEGGEDITILQMQTQMQHHQIAQLIRSRDIKFAGLIHVMSGGVRGYRISVLHKSCDGTSQRSLFMSPNLSFFHTLSFPWSFVFRVSSHP